jgi:hypothetical protein
VVAGSPVPITIKLSNTSILTWEPGEYTLGATGGTGRSWGVDTIPLPRRVQPGDQVTFAFTLTAPVEPNEYYLGWQMRKGGTAFGQGTGLFPITVTPGSEPVCVTLRREKERLVARIAALERELASITTDDPDWRQERLRVNAELRVARDALAAVNQQIAEQNCT